MLLKHKEYPLKGIILGLKARTLNAVHVLISYGRSSLSHSLKRVFCSLLSMEAIGPMSCGCKQFQVPQHVDLSLDLYSILSCPLCFCSSGGLRSE